MFPRNVSMSPFWSFWNDFWLVKSKAQCSRMTHETFSGSKVLSFSRLLYYHVVRLYLCEKLFHRYVFYVVLFIFRRKNCEYYTSWIVEALKILNRKVNIYVFVSYSFRCFFFIIRSRTHSIFKEIEFVQLLFYDFLIIWILWF